MPPQIKFKVTACLVAFATDILVHTALWVKSNYNSYTFSVDDFMYNISDMKLLKPAKGNG